MCWYDANRVTKTPSSGASNALTKTLERMSRKATASPPQTRNDTRYSSKKMKAPFTVSAAAEKKILVGFMTLERFCDDSTTHSNEFPAI